MELQDFVIVGTAGHIDHGKTALVKALTGVDTDRTREERERGISIDLGFAPLVLDGGQRIGIVDVPGHERFIRNMLAGAGGIDLILLVIDAREGVMPQTREHLAILDMLGTMQGVVVLTKVDLVDDEWLALVEDEIRASLSGTFLENAQLVRVSSVTGQGLPALRAAIRDVLPTVRRKPRSGPLRLPIDRIFSVQGIGTVVTGTVWRGEVKPGDALQILPTGEAVRVRGLQVHGETVAVAYAGQRAAVALAGGLRALPERGMTLGAPGAYHPTRLVDVRVRVLKDAPIPLTHRARIRFYSGTAEVMGRILLLGDDELGAGSEGLAQILLEKDAVCEARDHFVLRSFSPMHTIGGGTVIDPRPTRLHRRHSAAVRDRLAVAEKGTLAQRVLSFLQSGHAATPGDLAASTGEPPEAVEQALEELEQIGNVVRFGAQNALVPVTLLEEWQEAVVSGLREYYARNRYDIWASRAVATGVLKGRLSDSRWVDALLAHAESRGLIVIERDRVRLPDWRVQLTPQEDEMRGWLITAFANRPFDPPTEQELEIQFKGRERALRSVLRVLDQERFLVLLAPELYISAEGLDQAENAAQALYAEKGRFTVADFRDRLGTSRKFAVAILEYCDRQKWTRRVGDAREYIGRRS